MSRERFAGRAVAVVLVAVVAVALYLMGTPAEERTRRLDERRVQGLGSLAGAIEAYYARAGVLPSSLDEVRSQQGLSSVPLDPVTGANYEYRSTGSNTFELCASFDEDSPPAGEGFDAGAFWAHRAGRQCFPRTAARLP